MSDNDTVYSIAGWAFIILAEALFVSFCIMCKLPWWVYVFVVIGVFFITMLYRPFFEILLCLPALAIIGLLIYDAFDKGFSFPTVWIVLMIVWDVLFIVYMIFFSFLRETINERRMGMWK